MKKICHILYLLALPILVGSCIDAPTWSDDNPDSPEVKEVKINLSIDMPADMSSYFTRSSDTRAFDWQGEVNVSDAYILVFDADNMLIDIKSADEIAQSGDAGNVSFTFTLSTGGTRKLVVLANSEAILQATIGTNRNSQYIGWWYDTVLAQVYSGITASMFTGDPPGYIPMWGETGTLELVSGVNTTQEMRLMRAIARVDVGVGQVTWNQEAMRYTWNGTQADGNPIPFQIRSVTVVRPNNRFAVVPATANRDTATNDVVAPTVPTGTTAFTVAESMQNFTYNAPADIATTNAISNTIYIPEADVVMGAGGRPGDANHTNRMALVVGGSYNGLSTSYYRLDFAPAGALTNPLRNHLYQFNIQRVTSNGWATVEEAYRQASLNISASVIPWNLNNMGNIVFDGSNYFAMSPQQINFTPGGGQTVTSTIRTSVTDFALNLGGTTRLRAGGTMPVTYTEPSTGFVYTLNRSTTEPDTYTLTVNAPSPNATANQTTRQNDWTISAGRLNTNYTVSQSWANPYVSVANGTTTIMYPEGTNNNTANNLPYTVASAQPLTVSVTYSPTGAPIDWLHGVVTNPPLVNGVYTANMSLSVDPFVYGPNNTAERRATINVTPQGGQPSVYTIVQQAPYIMLSPNNVTIPHPAAPTTVDTPITVVTNILTSDLISPPTQTSSNVGLTYQSAVMPYALIGDVNSRDRRFIVRSNLNQNAVNYTAPISSTFTVTPNSAKYGTLPVNDEQTTVTVSPVGSNMAIYWNQVDFNQTPGTYAWKANPRYSDQSQTAIVPWNATRVGVDVVSNMSPAPDTSMGTMIAPMTPATVDRGNGSTAYAWEYTIPQTSYTLGNSYNISFHSTEPPGTGASLRFQQGVQYITRDGGTVGTVDFRGTTTTGTQATVNLRSNVNWTVSLGSWVPPVASGVEWISMNADGSGYSPTPITRDDRLSSIGYTTSYLESRDLLAAPHAISFYVSPITDFNPASGFANGVRTATVSFVNNSYDASTGGRRGAPNPAPIQIVQYAPTLVHAGSTLPAGNDRISSTQTPYTFTANTNLQGWGVRAYDGPYTAGKTPIASQDFTPQNPGVTINSTAVAQPYSTTLTLPANPSITNSRTVYFYYHSNEFPNRDPATMLIGAYNQDYSSANTPPTNNGGGGDFIVFDANNRMQVAYIADGSITATLVNRQFNSNLGMFKFGSAVGFDGNGVWGGQFGATTGTIKFNPITANRTISSYRDIPAYNNQDNPAISNAPGTYIGDESYNTFSNLRVFGQHDPCRLVGYTAAEVRNWTEAQYNAAMAASQWRIATAMENAYLVGGTGAATFNPTNPPTNWTRSTVFNNTWTAIYGYGYHQGTGSNDWNYEVMNQPIAQIAVPVVPAGQPIVPGHRIMGNSIRYAPTGQLGLDVPLQVNFWSGTVAYSSYDTGQLGYGVVRVPSDGNLYPSYQRHVDFGMPVRCIRR